MSGGAGPLPGGTSADEAAVGTVLDSLKTFRHAYWAPLLLGFVMLFDSWDSIAIAFAMPSLSSEWQLNPLTMGVIISAGYGGQFFGAIFLGTAAERFGRLPVLNIAVATMGLLAIGCAFAPNYAILLTLRALQGLMIGGAMPVAITYVNELAPSPTRGRYFGMFQTLAISGFAVASFLSPVIIGHLGWRWMLGLGAVPLVLLPLLWTTLPESPRWLARIGRRDAANQALVKLGGAPIAFASEVAAPALPQERRARMQILFTDAFRRRTLTVTLLWFLTMFTSFGITTWLPSIYVKVYDIPVSRALTYSAFTSCFMVPTLASIGFLIDRFGRRSTALTGMMVTAIALLALAAFQPVGEHTLVLAATIGQVGNLIGAFNVWPYTAETYPTDVRALALGYASSIGRFSSVVTPLFIGFVLNEGASISIVFACFGLCALAAFLIWLTRTRETAGMQLERI
jgi:putative MFS transporter